MDLGDQEKIKTLGRDLEFRCPEALLEPSPETSMNFKNFNFKYEEHSKRNHLNHLPRSQRSLESSLKASKNLNKLQIGEALRIQATRRTSATNLQIRRTFEAESSKLSA